jgi:hypothetical protein
VPHFRHHNRSDAIDVVAVLNCKVTGGVYDTMQGAQTGSQWNNTKEDEGSKNVSSWINHICATTFKLYHSV